MTKNEDEEGRLEARRTWKAIMKFCDDKPLTEQEWKDLSYMSLVDRNNMTFDMDNCRWAWTETERADNLKFYKSVGRSMIH